MSLSEITDYFYIDFKFLQQSLFRVKVNDNYLLIMRLKKKSNRKLKFIQDTFLRLYTI